MIRRALLSDLPEITRIRISVRENHLSIEQMAARGITQESVAAAISAGTLATWVSEAGADIVAFVMVDLDMGRLFALFTHPLHQGHGHGTALLAVAEQAAVNAGFSQISLDTGDGTSAADFYARRGYVTAARSEGNICMKKKLGVRRRLNPP